MSDGISLSKYVDNELSIRRISSPEHENVAPQLPRDITGLSSEELINSMAEYTSYMGYVASEAAKVGTQLVVKQALFNKSRQEKYKNLREEKNSGVKMTDKIMEAILDTDDKLEELERAKIMVQELKVHLDIIYQDSEKKLALLSRELTRRTSSREKGSL